MSTLADRKDQSAPRRISATSLASSRSTAMAATLRWQSVGQQIQPRLLLVARAPEVFSSWRTSRPVATEVLRRVAMLYAIEDEVRGSSAERRRALRVEVRPRRGR